MKTPSLKSTLEKAFEEMNAAYRARKLAQRGEMVAEGRLPEASMLPYSAPLDVDLVYVDTATGEVELSDRVLDALDLILSREPGKGELGFEHDGSAHLAFADDQDRLMFVLAFDGER